MIIVYSHRENNLLDCRSKPEYEVKCIPYNHLGQIELSNLFFELEVSLKGKNNNNIVTCKYRLPFFLSPE